MSIACVVFIQLQRNFLTGTIPTTLSTLTNLMQLWLHEMPLTGTIPSELGSLPHDNVALDLRLHNTQLEGTVPGEIWNTGLWRLDLYGANLSGTISPAVGTASNLQSLRLSDNNFSGTIPTELGLLTKVRVLWLDGNNFSGTLPTGVCELKGDTVGLFDLSSDCLTDPTTGEQLVVCDCCDVCCNPDTYECEGDFQCIEFC
jgi:uncharacterized protein YjbI with pentapeptide repeats